MIATKLAFVLFCWTAAFALPMTVQVFLMHVVFVAGRLIPALRPITPQARTTYIRFLGYAALLTALVVILNSLFVRSGEVLLDLGFLRFSVDGALFGLRVSARLVLMSTAVLAVFVSTPLRDFAAFVDTSGMPRVVTSVLLLSLEFVERLPSRIQQIFTAQEARGAPVRADLFGRFRSLLSILGPLLLSSIVESVERSHALALKGFPAPRDHARRTKQPLSTTALVLLVGTLLILLWSLWRTMS